MPTLPLDAANCNFQVNQEEVHLLGWISVFPKGKLFPVVGKLRGRSLRVERTDSDHFGCCGTSSRSQHSLYWRGCSARRETGSSTASAKDGTAFPGVHPMTTVRACASNGMLYSL